uniref:Carbamoyltransferase n=1 Tax=Candidatus Kentrum eta TaxID=2126337 RepID=A0A450UU95_9GAMM|nr:MAG: carbamoyltransferase [Candidatus Kentron sp. H]VFJ96107.1 MAG: carbamoyltransferase [Candidatus Kentron sp. H]VFK02166.1 MAG: carbamoyltransferase [Candidatus Kentron sp. H]
MTKENDAHILGIGGLVHDANFCLLDNQGNPIFVGEEERFCREKRRGGFPTYSISYLAKSYHIEVSETSTIVFSRETIPDDKDLKSFLKSTSASVVHVNHHLSHAAGTFYSAPFPEAAILTLDGLGDSICSIMAIGRGKRIEKLAALHYHHSLGILWMRTGWFLGFMADHFFSGAKVMALAAYGKPVYEDVFRGLFNLYADGSYELNPGRFPIESVARFWEKEKPFFLEKALGIPPREPDLPVLQVHKDIAASMQKVSEELTLHMVRGLHRRTGLENLCLAGGVALNCLQNARILRDGPFEKIFITPNASDCGNGMGAALYHYHHNLGGERQWYMTTPYLGAGYSTDEIESAITKAGVEYRIPESIAKTAAMTLVQGHVIGWFQGRAEIGPRALGNRSILADPRKPNIRNYLNQKIKHREWFRPFSAAILEGKVPEYFECKGDFPYMLFAFPARPDKADKIPGVLHVDMTSRIQTVSDKNNPLFHGLINEFYIETGIPMVLNTSFNDHGEPIVNSPTDALRRFLASGLDALAIGPFWIERS